MSKLAILYGVYMTIMLPSLTTKGWIVLEDHPLVVANYLIAHFFCSDYSQTQIYLKSVKSFAWAMQENRGDIIATMDSLKSSLASYFRVYFENADVTVIEYPKVYTNNISLTITVEFTSKGIKYNISRAIQIVDGIAQQIIEVSNYGGSFL
jgi:hypothetical protein